MQINVTPRPDILLTVLEERPSLLNLFIAHMVLPVFDAHVSTGPIPKVMRRNRIERLYRPRYGGFPRGQSVVNEAGTFDCEEQGFEEPYDAKDVEIYGTEERCREVLGARALQTLLLAHEKAVADSLMTTTVFGAGYNTAAAAAWDAAGGKPIDDVAKASDLVYQRIGIYPNTLVIGAGTHLATKINAQIQSNVRAILGYTDRDGINLHIDQKVLAAAFGIERVIIGGATYNSADEGQTASLARVWPDDKALVCYVPPENDDLSPGLGRTFVWDEGLMGVDPQADGIAAPLRGVALESYGEGEKNIGVIRARQYLDTLVLNKEAGHLLTGL